MLLANDLLATIAIYGAWPVTSNLLTVDKSIAGRAYVVDTWRTKAVYEARGLLLKDALVSGARWYRYYAIVNRTFYGRLYSGKYDRDIPIINPWTDYENKWKRVVDDPIIFLAALYTNNTHVVVYQTINGIGIIAGGLTKTCAVCKIGTIRRVVINSYGYIYILVDRGDIWISTGSVMDTRLEIVRRITGSEIVDMCWTDVAMILLKRDGSIDYVYNEDGYTYPLVPRGVIVIGRIGTMDDYKFLTNHQEQYFSTAGRRDLPSITKMHKVYLYDIKGTEIDNDSNIERIISNDLMGGVLTQGRTIQYHQRDGTPNSHINIEAQTSANIPGCIYFLGYLK